jgi:DNA-binding transcriptional LysR family regulator
LLELLIAEEIDFFMADPRLMVPDDRLQMMPLARLDGGLYCCRQHPLAKQGAVGHDALMQYGLATLSLTVPLRQYLAAALGFGAGQALPIRIECDDLAALCHIAQVREVLVLLPDAAANSAGKGLVKLPVENAAMPMFADLHAVWLRDRTLAPSAELAMQLAQTIATQLHS